jgi:hypothetical protein
MAALLLLALVPELPLRRSVLGAALASTGAPVAARAAPSDTARRVEEDLRRRADEVQKDVAYPPALVGDWQCTRQVRSVEGDRSDAISVWRDLGGRDTLAFRKEESFATRFVRIPDARRNAAVLDRGFEYTERTGEAASEIEWFPECPNRLLATPRSTAIVVTRRDVMAMDTEPPFGFRYAEAMTIVEEGGNEGGTRRAVRTVRVERRLRPADDGSIRATEIVTSYGAATAGGTSDARRALSVTTSSLKLTRRRGAPPRMMAGEGEETSPDPDLEAQRLALERLVRREASEASSPTDTAAGDLAAGDRTGPGDVSSGSDGGRDGAGFRYDESPPAVPDDIAAGAVEAIDVGRRSLGLLALGAEIGLGGLLSPFGVASFALFGLLVGLGEFGDSPERFVARAPAAHEGTYYHPREPTQLYQPGDAALDVEDVDGAVDGAVWP